MEWVVYILECGDSTLYVGVTNDLENRLAAHVAGKGARYTRGRAPLRVIHVEQAASRGEAQSREAAIRKLSRRKKLALATARHGDPRAPFLVERLDDPQDAWVLLQRGVARARNPATLEAAETDLGRAVALYGNTPSAPELVEARRALAGVRQQLRHSR